MKQHFISWHLSISKLPMLTMDRIRGIICLLIRKQIKSVFSPMQIINYMKEVIIIKNELLSLILPLGCCKENC